MDNKMNARYQLVSLVNLPKQMIMVCELAPELLSEKENTYVRKCKHILESGSYITIEQTHELIRMTFDVQAKVRQILDMPKLQQKFDELMKQPDGDSFRE